MFHTEQDGEPAPRPERAGEILRYYSGTPGSQQYPFPFGAFYPDRANFLAVVGNLKSRQLVIEFLRHFMAATDFPVERTATFSWIPGVGWSDHWSFWKEGYLAVMLTDTAPYHSEPIPGPAAVIETSIPESSSQ